MAKTPSIHQYRKFYARLLRLYPQRFYNRFGSEMEQTFTDLLRERLKDGSGLFYFAIWIFIETTAGIIKENRGANDMQLKTILRAALATLIILLIPFMAMQFTNEVNWSLFDFAIAGGLLFGTAMFYEFVAAKGGSTVYRAAVGVTAVAALLLVWVNLAVGLIGNEENPANLIYVGVLAVGLIGAIFTRFRPEGMARTLLATAVTQALATVVALLLDPRLAVFGLNVFFLILFVGSAWLFRQANRQKFEAELLG